MIRYRRAPDLEEMVRDIVSRSPLTYIALDRVRCVRSYGSKSADTTARIHTASKALLTGLGLKPVYVIEFISERFDSLSESEKETVIIHELLHIPRSLGGGLVGHGRIDFKREIKVIREVLRRGRS
ncbi:MAG: putative metallopeptidase [Nitrososphaerota archaeon]